MAKKKVNIDPKKVIKTHPQMVSEEYKPNLGGRPTKYTRELADRICEIISTSNRSMASICKEVDLNITTVFRWIDENEEFNKQYTRAKECQADYLVEEMLEIADDTSQDSIVKESNGVPYEVENKEFISRSRLKVETRKWLASKLKPKKYSESMKVEQSGEITTKQSIDLTNLTDEQLRILAKIQSESGISET